MTDSEGENTVGGALHEAGDVLGAEDRERRQRVEALRALSGENAQAPMAVPMVANSTSVPASGERRSGWRRVILIGLAALVIVGSVTGYLIFLRSKAPASGQNPPAVHAIDLGANKLYCPQAPVWSPDGRQIAVIASDARCLEQNSSEIADQSLAIFDATTGKPRHIIALKDTLAQHQLTGEASAIAWSPDGKILAIFGPVLPNSTIDANQAVLLLYSTTDPQAAPRVIIAPPQPDPYKVQVWNVGASAAGPVIDATLAPALSYRWTADGHITPDQPFSTDATGATGRAASNDDFTFWQAGQLDAMYILDGHYRNTHFTNGSGEPIEPTSVFFSALPVLWSSDGRYVVYGVGIGGSVTFSAPPTSTLTCPSPDQSQDIRCPPQAWPPSDPALTAVVQATLKGEAYTVTTQSGNQANIVDWPEVPVAWSPNGKFLITILPGDEQHEGLNKTTVTLFDTTTGNPVKQVQQVGADASCVSGPISWSSTGKQIAMSQGCSNSIQLLPISGLSA